MYLIGWLSLCCLVVFFSGALICSFIWVIFFLVSVYLLHSERWSLRCSPGWGDAGRCAVTLYVGEGLRGSNGTRSTLHQISVFSLHYPQSNWAPLVLIPCGWACTHSKPLWVSPMNYPVRLGVSPAAASTPKVFSVRGFEV